MSAVYTVDLFKNKNGVERLALACALIKAERRKLCSLSPFDRKTVSQFISLSILGREIDEKLLKAVNRAVCRHQQTLRRSCPASGNGHDRIAPNYF
jgi:hypothetical protein